MFEVETGDKRVITTPKQKASLISPRLVWDNEHRENCEVSEGVLPSAKNYFSTTSLILFR